MKTKAVDWRVEYDGGVYLPELELYLDPDRPRPFAFVSHAHSDHFARHEKILCSSLTRRLVETRFGSKAEFQDLKFGETVTLADSTVRLASAGHVPGSAQFHATRNPDGARLLFTGDFKLRQALAAEPVELLQADVLILETTFGRPRYCLPPAEQVLADMHRFVRGALDDGEIPVLAGYSFGKAQELILALAAADPDLDFALHPAVAQMTEALEELGLSFPKFSKFDPKEAAGKVVIVPPNAIRSQAIRRLKQTRTAVATGWALDPGARFRYQVDEAFPLSDHAGYDDLIRFVEAVGPKRVYTLHGFAADFAQDLRSRGWEAWSLISDDQLELGLPARASGLDAAGSKAAPAENTVPLPVALDSSAGFASFAAVCHEVGTAPGKLEKRDLLAEYLCELEPEELSLAATYLAGKPFSRRAEARALNVGWAVIRRALMEVTGRSEEEYRTISASQNEGGRTAFLMLRGRTEPRPHSIKEIDQLFRSLAAARGPVAKSALLAAALKGMHPREGQYLIGILSGELRIGLKEGLLEEGIATAFEVSPAAVRQAHMLTGDIGETASLAREGRLDEASVRPFVPLKCMLASPEPDGAAIWKRLAGGGEEKESGDVGDPAGETGAVWLEDKFDGIRAQFHKSGKRVELYSRDLRPLHGEFGELAEAGHQLKADVILDGEIIAFAEGRRLTFFDLQKRLGRLNEGDLFLGPSIPVRYVVFDLLWKDGQSTIGMPLAERRRLLETVTLPPGFEIAETHQAHSAGEIEELFKQARARGNEGLIAKDPDSAYSVGRRGKGWLKLKKAFSTLDVVVVKAEQGHGKRSHVLSDYTFAVRDEDTDQLRVIGKAYSGLKDEEIEKLTEHFKENTLRKTRRVHTVIPNVVLEIAFDSIQPSQRHNSGLALRFPRILSIRRDKTPDEIDTLAYARRLAAAQQAVPAAQD